jgi:hypothetical protein
MPDRLAVQLLSLGRGGIRMSISARSPCSRHRLTRRFGERRRSAWADFDLWYRRHRVDGDRHKLLRRIAA